MQGYLWGILVSQLVLAGIYFSVCITSSEKIKNTSGVLLTPDRRR